MTIQEYLDKNLPNLNWNILPQIFEENGVEMSEEAEAYLKNTPENTNWNVLKQMSEEEADTFPKRVIIAPTNGSDRNGHFTESSDFQTFEDLKDFIDKNKTIGNGAQHISADKLVLIRMLSNDTQSSPTYRLGASYNDGQSWTWNDDGDMEYRLNFANNTIGYYSYDD